MSEAARNLAIKRAFLRQAQTLNQHEGQIARHTAIQSWTNIIAVVTSVIMTVALAWIAWGQWKAGERAVALEYARSANQFVMSVTYKTASGHEYIPEESHMYYAAMPYRIDLRRLRGDNNIIQVGASQLFDIKEDFFGAPVCTIEVINWFEQVTAGEVDMELRDNLSEVYLTQKITSESGGEYFIIPGSTQVYVTYFDLFGSRKTDHFTVYGSTFESVEIPSEPDATAGFNESDVTHIPLVSADQGPMFWSNNIEDGSCGPFITDEREARELWGTMGGPRRWLNR